MPVPHLSPRGTVMMGGASVMRFFGQAMMYAFASGAVLAAPEGSPVAVAKPRGFFCVFFFFGWSKIKEDNHNQESLLMFEIPRTHVFFVVGCVQCFFSQIFVIQFVDFYSKVYVIFPDFALQPGISYTAATVEQRYSYIEWLHFYRKVHRGKKPGWKVGGCSHHLTGQAWVDISLPLFGKPLLQFLLGMIFRTLLSRAYLSCGFQFRGKLQSDIWWSPIQLEKDRNQFEVSTCFFWPGASLTSPVVFQSGGDFKDSSSWAEWPDLKELTMSDKGIAMAKWLLPACSCSYCNSIIIDTHFIDIIKTRWWFQIFCIFTPKFGEDSHFDEHIFQTGGSTTK